MLIAAPTKRAGPPRLLSRPRRGGRVVDRVALEMRSTRKRTGGSNPSLSAIKIPILGVFQGEAPLLPRIFSEPNPLVSGYGR